MFVRTKTFIQQILQCLLFRSANNKDVMKERSLNFPRSFLMDHWNWVLSSSSFRKKKLSLFHGSRNNTSVPNRCLLMEAQIQRAENSSEKIPLYFTMLYFCYYSSLLYHSYFIANWVQKWVFFLRLFTVILTML